jgi:predicted metalloendopeptidase
MKNNPIPPEYSTWGSFTVLADKNQQALRQILEAAEKSSAPDSWAQVCGANRRLEFAGLMANTNRHPLPRFRGNGPLSNMAEFAHAFACKKGDPMVRERACKIW